jgi:hypothetical protein
MRGRLTGALVLSLSLSQGGLAAQSSDLAGEWLLSVDVDGSVTTPTLTLEQSGDSLAGTYVSETLGRARVRGAVDGAEFTISFTASLQGQSLPVRYRGEVREDGTLAGRMDLADGMVSGTFTARRKPPATSTDTPRPALQSPAPESTRRPHSPPR